MSAHDAVVAVIGGGVVGAAVARALAARGTSVVLIEAAPGLALGASGTNSGILHTGFDSIAGELETELLLRAAQLRPALLERLAVPVLVCGARLAPHDSAERRAVAALLANARANGVSAELDADGALHVPDESVTDPVALVHALAADAQHHGAEVRLGAAVEAIEPAAAGSLSLSLAGGGAGSSGVGVDGGVGDGGVGGGGVGGGGGRVRVRAAVNCAGLFADEVARMAGDDSFSVYPRKGEFLVFDPPSGGRLAEILLPVPTARGKGVLVFPTVDGQVIAGPTARDREDKRAWSVEPDAAELISCKATRAWPPLADCTLAGSYAGLRPAGRGVNYVIERSRALPSLVHVAAIRSTGLSASLAIGEFVARMLADAGLVATEPEPGTAAAGSAAAGTAPPGDAWAGTRRPGEVAAGTRRPGDAEAAAVGADRHWWQRAARHHAGEAVEGAGR